MAQLSKLFQPGTIGTLEIPNRMILAAMHIKMSDENGYLTQRAIDYYVERAKGGVGLLTTQATKFLYEARAHR